MRNTKTDIHLLSGVITNTSHIIPYNTDDKGDYTACHTNVGTLSAENKLYAWCTTTNPEHVTCLDCKSSWEYLEWKIAQST